MISKKSLVEAVLFAAAKPLKTSELEALFGGEIIKTEIEDIIQELEKEHQQRMGGFTLNFIPSEGYQFRVVENSHPIVEKMFLDKPRPLSKASLETLAIIAYRQPVSRAEIEFIRGVDSGGLMKSLLEKGLIACVGRKNEIGKPMIFGTTDEFLKIFRLSSLKDLPSLESFQPPKDDYESMQKALNQLNIDQNQALLDEAKELASIGDSIISGIPPEELQLEASEHEHANQIDEPEAES